MWKFKKGDRVFVAGYNQTKSVHVGAPTPATVLADCGDGFYNLNVEGLHKHKLDSNTFFESQMSLIQTIQVWLPKGVDLTVPPITKSSVAAASCTCPTLLNGHHNSCPLILSKEAA